MRLVGDFGGSTVRLALAAPGGGLRAAWVSPSAAFAGPEAAIAAWLAETGAAPREAVLAAAGPEGAQTLTLTNSGWRLDAPALRARFGFGVRLINDFAALALAVPGLGDAAFETLLDGAPRAEAPIAVLGPGTGLGLALLVPAQGAWRIVATEGGHRAFAPETAEERALLERLAAERRLVSCEDLISGPGLARLHRALGGGASSAPEIAAAAKAGEAGAVRTAQTFALMLASFARDAVLTTGARGGCVIAGGVAEGLAAFLRTPAFAARFRAHPTMAGYLSEVRLRRLTDPLAGLKGAAIA